MAKQRRHMSWHVMLGVFRRQEHEVAEGDSEGKKDASSLKSKLFPWYAFPYGISPHYIWIERCAENHRHPHALRGACLRLPCHGLASSASELTVPSVPGRGGLCKLGPDCLRQPPFPLTSNSQGRIRPRKRRRLVMIHRHL